MPLWASNGRELFYWHGTTLLAVPVQTEPSFTPGTPEALFEGDYLSGAGQSYDVSPDGAAVPDDHRRRRSRGHVSAGQHHRRPELVRGIAAAGADGLICLFPLWSEKHSFVPPAAHHCQDV